MKKWLIKVYCFLRGHDFISLYRIDNMDRGGRSYWGTHKCMRCGKEEHWQWDF